MAVTFISNIKDLIAPEGYKLGTLKNVVDWLQMREWFCVDTETNGLLDFVSKVIMLQIGDHENQFVIDTRGLDISELKPYFEDDQIMKILHNAKFDTNMLRSTFGFRMENVFDTFLAECCLTTGMKDRRLGLDYVISQYCGKNLISKEQRGSFAKVGNKPFTTAQILYGAGDIQYLPMVMKKQMEEIAKKDLTKVLELENKVVLCLADMEYNGIILNPSAWLNLANKAQKTVADYEKELDNMVLNTKQLAKYKLAYVQSDLFGGTGRQVDINWSSPKQMGQLFRDLGLLIESTSEKDITKYQNTHPLVKKFIDFKKQQKLVTTYGEDFLDYINTTSGRIHTNFWQILETGRLSSNNPNMQNIPAKPEYLACFVAHKGWKMVVGDYSGQELRMITEGSQDPIWVNAFNEGKDLHGEIAAMVFNIPIGEVKNKPEFVFVGSTKVYLRGKSPRDVAKTINFMLAYGGSEFKLSGTLGITVDEAKAIITKYFEAVPRVKAFLGACAKYGVTKGYIRTFKPFSLIRYFAPINTDKERGEVERMSKNTPKLYGSMQLIAA